MLLAGPGEQQATVLKALKLAGLENVGVERRQGIDELFKLGIVFQRVVRVGDGTAADEGAQIFHGLVTVDGFLALGHSGGSAGVKRAVRTSTTAASTTTTARINHKTIILYSSLWA